MIQTSLLYGATLETLIATLSLFLRIEKTTVSTTTSRYGNLISANSKVAPSWGIIIPFVGKTDRFVMVCARDLPTRPLEGYKMDIICRCTTQQACGEYPGWHRASPKEDSLSSRNSQLVYPKSWIDDALRLVTESFILQLGDYFLASKEMLIIVKFANSSGT